MADKGFDLAAMLQDVSKLDTGREQIEYIPIDQIDSDPKNFYTLSNVEELAANIELVGLQQPLRVRERRRPKGDCCSHDACLHLESQCIVTPCFMVR